MWRAQPWLGNDRRAGPGNNVNMLRPMRSLEFEVRPYEEDRDLNCA